MKKITLLAIAAFILSGCADKKAQKQAALDSVTNIHDKVMAADEQLMKNKMELDTLIKKHKLLAKDSVALLQVKLVAADSAMDVWMHNFDFEQKGKTDDETIAYMHDQKKLIMVIDSQLGTAVNESNKYLSKIKTK